MNIFWLDDDIEKCAKYHCDKHIVKMPVEYAQLLSSAAVHYGHLAPYKETHKNHPCAIWARESEANYALLYDLAVAVGAEYTRRYNKVHKSTIALEGLPKVLGMSKGATTPLPNCTTLKEQEHLSIVDRYRLYYLRDKAHILQYKHTEEPWWMGDRFYRQQLESIGTCPGYHKQPKHRKLKSEYVEELGLSGIDKLTVVDLDKLSPILKGSVSCLIPSGRLKAPYIKEANKIAQLDWNKLTVATLKAVLEKYSC